MSAETLTLCPVILPEDPALLARAERLAAELKVPLLSAPPEDGAPALLPEPEGLTLIGGGLRLRGELSRLLPRLRPDRISGELLLRAAKPGAARGPLTAVDATAGLGEDALLLAAAGYQVRLYELDQVIAALLADSLERAARDPRLAEAVGRMRLTRGDSVPALRALDTPPDLILLDPMFPARRKSALIGKKLQLLQRLEAPCADEEALLAAALAARPRRVVVKRPAKGPWLAGKQPSHSIPGKAVRYDCYVLPPGG